MNLYRVTAPVPALLALTCMLLFATATQAEPWVGPGEMALRHDLQQLADAGVLHAPTMSWPLPWSDIKQDIGAADSSKLSPRSCSQPWVACSSAQHAETATGGVDLLVEVAGTTDPWALRSFEDPPREEGELTRGGRLDRRAIRLEALGRLAASPDDGQEFRPDGSYVAMSLGNWSLSAGYLDRWWGPGWEGSLILSDNARPVPSFGIDRIEAKPFTLPVLRWLGPWRFSTFMGQLEEDRDYPEALLFGMRFESRPLPSLQIAASRSAQWCGEGRPCDLSTFGDLLTGNDNDQALADQPGNQLAGFDVRWSWPGGRVPLALYAQAIGEDEAGFMPSKYLGLFGAEGWGEWGSLSWRAHAEYADTACDFPTSPPEFGCAYTNGIYTSVDAASAQGISAALFYLAVYSLMTIGAFAVVTVISREGDGHTSLADLRGLPTARPALALALVVFVLAQAGVPFTGGFFAKFGVITAAVDAGHWWMGVAAMVSAVVSAFLYLRIVGAMYWPSDEAEDGATPAVTRAQLPFPRTAGIALGLCLVGVLIIGIFPGLITNLTRQATVILG
ncbi:MAG: capsule assembly Wzi family protein [Nocardioides sp.]